MPDDRTPASELEELAQTVRGLRYDFRDAERFYELRSEVSAALMRLSRRLSCRAMPAPPVLTRVNTSHRPRVVATPVRLAAPMAIVAPAAHQVVRNIPQSIAGEESSAPVRPRPRWMHRHRYPRPPTLPVDVQPRML